jgi:hypothetical protein
MKLISLLPLNLREAEKDQEDKKAADDAEADTENPFAAADDKDAGADEEGEADAGAEDGKEGEEGGEKTTEDEKPLDVVFNPTRVRKYNDVKFNDNKGTVVAISRFGLTVKLPDETTVFVNFEDIL